LPKNLPNSGAPLLANSGKGIYLADFYDVVFSEFFSCAWNFPHAPRNWYSGLTASDPY